MSGYIYLIQLREFINSNQSIYKIGKTGDTCCRKINKRFSAYPKDSVVKIIIQVNDMDTTENNLIQKFGELFEKQPSIGPETFKGNLHNMIIEICKFIPNELIDNIADKKVIDYTQIENSFKTHDYYPICRDIKNKIQNNYTLHNVRNIYDIYGLSAIINGDDSPTCETPTIVDINKIITELKKLYDKPTKSKIVSCDQYYKFCGFINTMARLVVPIDNYEKKRLTMPNPKNYIQIKTKPVIEIAVNIYSGSLKKCNDFDKAGLMYLQQFPW
jgi:hypothetical protein